MPPGDPFGDLMNAPTKYVVSRTLEKPLWRDTTIIRENVIESVRALKNQPGGNIVTDGSSQLVHALLAHDLVDELHLLVYPLTLGSGKRAAERCAQDIRLEVRDTVSERRNRPPLRTHTLAIHYLRSAAIAVLTSLNSGRPASAFAQSLRNRSYCDARACGVSLRVE